LHHIDISYDKKQNTISALFSSGVNVTYATNVDRNGSMDIYAKREYIDEEMK